MEIKTAKELCTNHYNVFVVYKISVLPIMASSSFHLVSISLAKRPG